MSSAVKIEVDAAPGRLQDAREELDVEPRDPLHDPVDQPFVRHHVHEHLLEAAHVPGCFEDVPVSHHDAPVPAGQGRRDERREGPRSRTSRGSATRCASEFGDAARRGEGIVIDLVVAAASRSSRRGASRPRCPCPRARGGPMYRGLTSTMSTIGRGTPRPTPALPLQTVRPGRAAPAG